MWKETELHVLSGFFFFFCLRLQLYALFSKVSEC